MRSSPPPPALVVPAQRKPAKLRDPDAKGAPIPRDLRLFIYGRDEGLCQRCGRYCLNDLHSLQHRGPRQAGGSVGAHYSANLVLLCGSATSPHCHHRTESYRIEARELGWLVRRKFDPRTVPVFRFGRSWEQPGDLWLPADPIAA